ncbi:MAG: class I SAM-dependent methyltransferase [Desulfamplus sp.]|nr:class I SAM-dependent methyltransferase [Desulfamplus sp.]
MNIFNKNIFNNYADYYDLFYQDKDYVAEAAYVDKLIQSHSPGAVSILDLGCGTGGHAYPMASMGYKVSGVDLSEKNIKIAQNKQNNKNNSQTQQKKSLLNPHFHTGDIRTIRLGEKYDAIISLFHVMSYQTSHEDIISTLHTVKKHLKPNGIFCFDFWYGPGVLSDPPKIAVKQVENNELKATRIAEPSIHANKNTVDVNYSFFISLKDKKIFNEINENHSMRYFFMPEMKMYLDIAKLKPLCFYAWMTMEEPDIKTWSAFLITRSESR